MAPARVATPSLLALVSLTVLALALSATEGYKLEANVVEVGARRLGARLRVLLAGELDRVLEEEGEK